jgi:hypothetical protein
MIETPVLLGNACSLLAMGTDSLSSAQKTAKRVLWVQTLSQVFYLTGTVFLKGYSGTVQNALSIVRNLVAIRQINSKVLEWTLVFLGVALGIWFNNIGFVGLFPVIANLQYTLCVFRFKDNETALKWSFMICIAMFAVFNLFIQNYVGFGSNAVVAIATAISLLRKKAAK